MILSILAVLFATLNAIASGYYLVQALTNDEVRRGSYIFSGLAGITAFLLFTLAIYHK